MHFRNEFSFEIAASYDVVAPLFGAHEERRWAEGWNPRFIHPQPAADVEGSVFLVEGPEPIVWINTIFDLERGRVQYANFNARGVVTRIDIHLSRGPSTSVRVVYERTALSEEALDLARTLADADAQKAPDWQTAITAATA